MGSSIGATIGKIVIFLLIVALTAVLVFLGIKIFQGLSDESEEGRIVCAADLITEEDLDSFNPDIPLAPGWGSSQPIDIQPLPEVHISAPAGAFETDREIYVREATGEEMQMLDEQIRRVGSGAQMLWAYDIDAGLAPDEVIPGNYAVEIDLKQLDISAELYPYIELIRMDGASLYKPVNSRIQDGVLRCEVSQNSYLVTCIVGGIVLVGGAYYNFNKDYFGMSYDAWAAAGYPLKFWETNDLVSLRIKDPFGDFNVYFRYSETENYARTKQYVEKSKQLETRIREIALTSVKQYAKEKLLSLDLLTDGGLMTDWTKDKDGSRGIITDICAIAIKKMAADTLVTRLISDPDLAIPESVQAIIKGSRMANRFLRTEQKLKPLSYAYPVYIVKGDSNVAGKRTSTPILGSNISVSWIFYLKKDGDKITLKKNKLDAAMVSVAHETFHIYQIEYITSSLFRDMRFFEATGSVVEHMFAAWMKKEGVFKFEDIETAPLGYTERDIKEFLNWPLAKSYPMEFDKLNGVVEQKEWYEKAIEWATGEPDVSGGYMLGDLIQYLQDNKKKVTLADMMAGYAYNKTIVKDLMDIYGIETEVEFAKYFEGFCLKYMDKIVDRTCSYNDEAKYNNLVISRQYHDSKHPLIHLDKLGHNGTAYAYPYTVKPVQIISKEKRSYNLWAYPTSFVKPSQLKFGFLTEDKKDFAKNRFFIKPCDKEYKEQCNAALIYRPGIAGEKLGSSYYIDIVAYYQPAQPPKVLGETQDGGGLNIHTGDAPSRELADKHYLAGMQLAIVNNATGRSKTFTVPLEKCGKEVKIPYEEIGISDPQNIDITLRTRWYNTWGEDVICSPATDKVKYTIKKQPEKKAAPTPEPQPEKKPEKEETPVESDEGFEEPSGDVDTDRGPILIEKDIRLSGVGPLSFYADEEPFYGHIVIKQKSFTMTIPACTRRSEGYYPTTTSMPGITIKGKCEKITDYEVRFDPGSIRVSPEVLIVTSDVDGSDLTRTYTFVGASEEPVYLDKASLNLSWKVNLSVRSVKLPGNNEDYYDNDFYVHANFSD